MRNGTKMNNCDANLGLQLKFNLINDKTKFISAQYNLLLTQWT